jgi:hypothetical protein
MSAASGLAAAKNRRCKDGPIVKVQGKPSACAPNTSCSRTSGPASSSASASSSSRSSRSAPQPAAAQTQQAPSSPREILQLLAGKNARELSNGVKVPSGPLTPLQIMQLHELRLTQLENDMTQIVQVISDASDAQAQLDSQQQSVAPMTMVAESAPAVCGEGQCDYSEDIDSLFNLSDETKAEVAALRSELQQSKGDFFKVQTFAMEAHMTVTKLAAELQRLQQQVAALTSPTPSQDVTVDSSSPSPTPTSGSNISEVWPTFSVESMHC